MGDIGFEHLARLTRVPTCSVETILRRHNVQSIGVIATDCEGYDCSILQGLMRVCKTHPSWYPHWIWFESNGMNDEKFGKGTERRTVHEIEKHGYELWWGGGYHLTGKRDTLMRRKLGLDDWENDRKSAASPEKQK